MWVAREVAHINASTLCLGPKEVVEKRANCPASQRDEMRLSASKVERLCCSTCGADEIVGWIRSNGLPRYRCKACGRTFNAAIGTGMAQLRKNIAGSTGAG